MTNDTNTFVVPKHNALVKTNIEKTLAILSS